MNCKATRTRKIPVSIWQEERRPRIPILRLPPRRRQAAIRFLERRIFSSLGRPPLP